MLSRKTIPCLVLVLAATPRVSALDAHDSGEQWVQASEGQKARVSAEFVQQMGGSAWHYVQCLNDFFADQANAKISVEEAATLCNNEER